MAKSVIPKSTFDPNAIDVAENLTLVVAERKGKRLRGYRVALHKDVARELRKMCKRTLSVFQDRTPRAFDPDGLIEQDEYLTAADAVVDTDTSVKKLLAGAHSLAFLDATKLPTKGFQFYAVLVGANTEGRVGFIRVYNPTRVAKPGRFWAIFGEDLRKLEEPVFVFDALFEIVVTNKGIAALNQGSFERIFRDLSVMTGRLPDYVEHITEKLPMADDGGVRFLAKCVQNSRVANRARAIFERGHLSNVSIDMIRKEIKKQNLDEKKLIKNGKLVFDDADPYTLLKLLNEDLFIGGLSRTPYAADRKSARA